MRLLANHSAWLIACSITVSAVAFEGDSTENKWEVSDPIFFSGPEGSFDEISVKDPSVVCYKGKWHMFYTARSKGEYTTGYVSANELFALQSAQRYELKMIRGKSRYGCAPQVFYYKPQCKWYLIFQNRDSNYQPMFSATTMITKPETWSDSKPLLLKDTKAKWIDFWVICTTEKAYLFYTEGHNGVVVRSTSLKDFPNGWSQGKKVFKDIHEAVHVYKVQGRTEYHMIYELNKGNVRSFGRASANALEGPWKKVTDSYATGKQLTPVGTTGIWTAMVSHGEVIRSGYNEQMEYDPKDCQWLIQGILGKDNKGPYELLPWKLGIMSKVDSSGEQDAPADADKPRR